VTKEGLLGAAKTILLGEMGEMGVETVDQVVETAAGSLE
jgi:hypothetical protein